MQLYSLRKVVTALVVAILLTTSFVAFTDTTGFAAPVSQETRAQEVSGTLPGGEFAKIWLGLEPASPGAQVTIVSEWDTPNPADSGLNFFILDDQGLQRIGDESLSSIALGAGSSNFVLNGPNNVLGASFNAAGLGPYTLVVANDSNQDANFTLRVTNGFILDDSNQVTDLNAAPAEDETAAEDEAATDDEAAAEDTEATDTEETTEAAVTATPEPAATTAPTTTTTVTETTTTTATVESTATEEAPAAVTPGGTVRATSLSGNLPNQNDQHFLALEPGGRDVQVTLNLTIEPQDNSELARRLNFWVLDPTGFNQFLGGSDPSDVAIAAGNRVFRGQDNERVASFRVSGSDPYTVIIYNTATVPGSYTLEVENGLLVDDSGQTNESIAGGSAALGATGATTGTVTADGTITGTTTATTTAGTTTTDSAATTATAREGTPGGTYTVQSGDTLALIARDIYGDLNLYEEICAFNEIANCNVIEVGDVIQLPTQAQISAGIAAPAATPAPTATPATATADDATTDDDAATDDATTGAVEPTATPALTTTETVTDTETTESADEPAATEDEAGAGSGTIYQTLVDNGNFTTLVRGLEETGLDSALDGAGDYTLFAPTDAAFVALRNRFSLTEDQLLGLPELADVLRYHVVDGTLLSDEISDGTTATTLQGDEVNFVVDDDTVRINNAATLIATDVETANGVIHVIEAVILPPN